MKNLRTWFLISALLTGGAALRAGEPGLTFEHDVRPILKAHCFHCHGEGGKQEGGVDLRLRRFMGKKVDDGPVMEPGHPEASVLLKLARSGEMPKEGKRLTGAELDVLEKWIASGAPTVAPEPETIPGVYITEAERNFWSFKPVVKPVPPRAEGNPVDAFISTKLAGQGLDFAPEADRRMLIRRLYFDLLGLPPAPEEVDAFLADTGTDAWEKLVDRVLASPRYGEHWGRHWLDAAGYADSNGFTESDSPRPHAWHFRDYVIRSLNEDKPWDRFIQEQLAGDEMTGTTHFHATQVIHNPGVKETLAATGFLRMGPDGTADNPPDANLARNQVLAETLKVVSSSLLGLTVGCAQCHDHRYDPVSQQDYYRLRAIFEPAYNWKKWRAPGDRLYSLYTEEDRKKAVGIEEEAKKKDEARKAKAKVRLDEIFAERLAKFPAEQQEFIRTGRNTPPAKRTAEQTQFFKDNPGVNVGTDEGLLDVFDQKAWKANKEEKKQTDAFRATRPPEEFIMALTEILDEKPETFLFNRGDHDQPKDKVAPGELEVISTGAPAIPPQAEKLTTTGRRLAYAQWLTSGRHPLVGRVLVNRFWLRHFSRGLVGTPGDFGLLGERPVHPELLDWLAADFMQNGWQLKRLHRIILTSRTWRQSSRNDASLAKDPDNRFFARMKLRRLEAEAVRDSMLAVSGRLNDKAFGPPVPVARHASGRIVTGGEELNPNSEPVGVKNLGTEEFRRSIYIEQRRSRPLTVLDTFDLPVMSPNCEVRPVTTVAPQSLMLMNDTFVIDQARALAERICTDVPGDHLARITRAWQLVYSAPPAPADMERSLAYLVQSHNDWPGLCQVLLSANRFLYVE